MKTYKFKILSLSFLILILSGNLVKSDNTTANTNTNENTNQKQNQRYTGPPVTEQEIEERLENLTEEEIEEINEELANFKESRQPKIGAIEGQILDQYLKKQ